MSVYPYGPLEIRNIVLDEWNELCNTEIGNSGVYVFDDKAGIAGQTAGQFLETLIAQRLNENFRQGNDAEKDFVHENPAYSTELKFSGQVDDKVYGNKSYAVSDGSKKDKSSYYITVNAHISEELQEPTHSVFCIRYGKLCQSDWTGQSSDTGQAASLSKNAYENKLSTIQGTYMYDAPLELAHGIGETTFENCKEWRQENDIVTVRDALGADDTPSRVQRAVEGFPENTIP